MYTQRVCGYRGASRVGGRYTYGIIHLCLAILGLRLSPVMVAGCAGVAMQGSAAVVRAAMPAGACDARVIIGANHHMCRPPLRPRGATGIDS